jgi:hypothetical protein
MSNKLPPLPVGVAPGSGYWNDWYEKLRTLINSFAAGFPFSSIINTPTTLAGYGITNAYTKTETDTSLALKQNISEKDAMSGYAGLNSVSRTTKGIDTTDDLVIDLATKGLVLKDTQGTPHYWRVTISTLGVLTTTDLGTTKP